MLNVQIKQQPMPQISALKELYVAAFPDEDLLPLLQNLYAHPEGVVSLSARVDNDIVGHCVFTDCELEKVGTRLGLLGPLAVMPDVQNRRIGQSLVKNGLDIMRERKVGAVCVLGDPRYYCRFGFERCDEIHPPFTLPPAWREAWQIVYFSTEIKALNGVLSVPSPWQHKALWSA